MWGLQVILNGFKKRSEVVLLAFYKDHCLLSGEKKEQKPPDQFLDYDDE